MFTYLVWKNSFKPMSTSPKRTSVAIVSVTIIIFAIIIGFLWFKAPGLIPEQAPGQGPKRAITPLPKATTYQPTPQEPVIEAGSTGTPIIGNITGTSGGPHPMGGGPGTVGMPNQPNRPVGSNLAGGPLGPSGPLGPAGPLGPNGPNGPASPAHP